MVQFVDLCKCCAQTVFIFWMTLVETNIHTFLASNSYFKEV
jgi:hypothetical protein